MGGLKTLKNIDVFGQPIQFTLQNQHSQTSIFGGILTLVFLGTFASIAFRGVIDLFSKNNVTSYTSDIYNFSPPFINFTDNGMKFAFTFSDPTLNSEKYFKVELIQGHYVRFSNGSSSKIKSYKNIIPCPTDYFDAGLKPALDGLTNNISQFYCPLKNDTFSGSGKYTSEIFDFVNLKVSKCQNTSLVQNCFPDSQLTDIFKQNDNNIYFNVYISNNVIDINNIDNYLTTFLDDRIYVLVDLSYYKEKNYYFTSNVVLTDGSLLEINPSQEEFTTYTFENIYDEATVLNDVSNPNQHLVNIYFRSNFLSKKQDREVQKIEDFIGYIGGFWSGIFLIFARIGRKYNKNKFLMKVARSLYYFPDLKLSEKMGSNDDTLEKRKIFVQKTKRRKGLNVQEIKLKKHRFKENIEDYMEKIRNGFKIFKRARAWFSFSPQKFYSRVKLETTLKNKVFRTMYKDIDIIHLLEKVKEIDKLKSILLDINQKNMFDYIPKSKITLDNDDHFRMNRSSLLFLLRNRGSDRISKKDSVSNYKLNDFYILYKSYQQMLEEKDPKVRETNMKIIKTLDAELLKIFKAESEKKSPGLIFSQNSKNNNTLSILESK